MVKYIFHYSIGIDANNIYILFTKFDDEIRRAKVRDKIFQLYFQLTLCFTHFVYLLYPFYVALIELLLIPINGIYISFDKWLEYLNNYLPLLFNKVEKTRSKHYIRYGFNMTKTENTKVEKKESVKYQANKINAPRKQLLPEIMS